MGEVYRARDIRLDRTVAIKVLPDRFAEDPVFRERLQREARAISQLTHPSICTLHDMGEQAGALYLVMEFLGGETLADRLARGTADKPVLSLDETLRIARQVAEALSAAHRLGIIHRDLKPGNVMLTKAGAKLLDFGLAKSEPPIVLPSASELTMAQPHALTVQGTILGTLHYMAPEQLQGLEVDARADIFAFGCVLYEMLTGAKPFDGKSPASLIAAILERDPQPMAMSQPSMPRFVDSIVQRCLAKNPEDRWQSAADLASALKFANDAFPIPTATHAGDRPSPGRRLRLDRMVAAVLAAVTLAAGAFGAWRYVSTNQPSALVESVQFEILPPPEGNWSPSPVGSSAQLALSPDGRQLAFVAATRRGVSHVWARPLSSSQARPLAGTEGATFPFWSPDSRSVGFFADGKLKKIDIAGGKPQALADAPNGRGGSWSASGEIIFNSSPNGPLSRVSAAGGPVREATTLNPDQQAITHYWPQFLTDGRRFLYYQRSAAPQYQGVYAASLDSPTTTFVLSSDGTALITPGYLLLVRDGMLFAYTFDERTLTTSGDPVRIADNVGYFAGTLGYISASASRVGSVAYGPAVITSTNLQWRDRVGGSTWVLPPGSYRSPRLSPDQRTVALTAVDAQQPGPDIWLLELSRGTLSRVTSHPQNDWFPAWAPDSTQLFFASTRTGSSSLFRRAASGVTPEEQLTEPLLTGTYPTDVSSDGRWIATHQVARASGYDMTVVEIASPHARTSFASGTFNQIQGVFSPNVRWMAFASDESGRFEVYVRPFPVATGQWTISIAGGMQPLWRRDGKELFYLAPDGSLMSVLVKTDQSVFEAGVPRALFKVEVPEATAPFPTDYAVTADGQRFLINTVVDQQQRPTLSVILNWAGALKQ